MNFAVFCIFFDVNARKGKKQGNLTLGCDDCSEPNM